MPVMISVSKEIKVISCLSFLTVHPAGVLALNDSPLTICRSKSLGAKVFKPTMTKMRMMIKSGG